MAFIEQVKHKKNPKLLCLKLTRSYRCQFSGHEQIQDALLSSLMMFLTYCEIHYYFVEMNIAYLLYCIDLLSLESFCPILVLLIITFGFTVQRGCYLLVSQSILMMADNKKLSSPQGKSSTFLIFLVIQTVYSLGLRAISHYKVELYMQFLPKT